eukprot:ANDGO_08484.mRNA.1 hypothetical protein
MAEDDQDWKKQIDSIPRESFYETRSGKPICDSLQQKTIVDQEVRNFVRDVRRMLHTLSQVAVRVPTECEIALLKQRAVDRARARLAEEEAVRTEQDEFKRRQNEAAHVYRTLENEIPTFRVKNVPLLSPFVYDARTDMPFVLDAIREFETRGKITPLNRAEIESVRNSLLSSSAPESSNNPYGSKRLDDESASTRDGSHINSSSALEDDYRPLIENTRQQGIDFLVSIRSFLPENQQTEKLVRLATSSDDDALKQLRSFAEKNTEVPSFVAAQGIDSQWRNPLPFLFSRL